MLAYSYSKKTVDSPLFLNIKFRKPIGIFGGDVNSAAIDSRGSVIIINASIFENETASPPIFVLPNNEKAVSVACCNKFIVVLSKSGTVYYSQISVVKTDSLSFSKINVFERQVVDISGTREHCLDVTSNGRVYGYGFNNFGQLGIVKTTRQLDSYLLIESLRSYSIKVAYAGYVHSLFQTNEGMILACGKDIYSSLLIKDKILSSVISTTTKTIVEKGASYANAGTFLSVIFTGCQAPINAPNKKVDFNKQSTAANSDSIFSKTSGNIAKLGSFTPDIHKEKKMVITDSEKANELKKKIELQEKHIKEKENQLRDLQKSFDNKVEELNGQIQASINRYKEMQKTFNDKIDNLNNQIKLKTSRIEELERSNNNQGKTQELEDYMKSKAKSEEKINENNFIDEDDEEYQIVLGEIGKGSASTSYKIIDTKRNQVMCKKVIYSDKNEFSFKDIKMQLKSLKSYI